MSQSEITWYVTKDVAAKLISIVQSRYPNEACGLLAGQDHHLTEAIEVYNSVESGSPLFYLEPKEMIRSIQSIREKGLQWMGVFHSHPNGSIQPSRTDIENWHYPNLLYCIAAVESYENIPFKIYRLKNEEFIEQTFTYS
jgi:proteasome lid subunit RPN8/RPN11